MLFKRLIYAISNFFRICFNLAYGAGNCLICDKETVMGSICKSCRSMLLQNYCTNSTRYESCSICGKVLISEIDICMSCRKERILKSCNKVISILPYRMWGKTLIFNWKMLEHRELSSFIAQMCYRKIKSSFSSEQRIIVPVPPRPGKIRRKGWDQIDELCKYLEYMYGYKVLKLLKRKINIQQKKLDRKQRLDKSCERYVLSKKGIFIKREKLPKCVILIDDVMTTGITVESCAKILKSIGIQQVDVLTVFIVD